MFLLVRKVLYLLLSIGSIAGSFLALLGLLIAIPILVAGIAKGSLVGIGLGLLMVLACVAGASGPAWILITVILLPNPSPRERRLLSGLLLGAVLAAIIVSASLIDVDENSPDSSLWIVAFVVPALVGCALIVELWLPVWRAGHRPG